MIERVPCQTSFLSFIGAFHWDSHQSMTRLLWENNRKVVAAGVGRSRQKTRYALHDRILPCANVKVMPIEGAGGSHWTADSWRERPALQQPEYPDAAALERVLVELSVLPPLVTSWEIMDLRTQLAEATA